MAVMFTVFRNTSDKLFIHSNAIRNWATFLPKIQPVLFATFNSGPLIDLAIAEGWIVYSYSKTNIRGTPLLKPMYQKAMDNFNAHFYAYCNGDILFGESLPATLEVAIKQLEELNTTMIVGRRWDYTVNNNASVYNDDPIWKPEKATSLSNSQFSTLHSPRAKDYFFVTRDFPWSLIKNVVIGRIWYDNYLVTESVYANVTTIDATGTILALHQTGADGNSAGRLGRMVKGRTYNGHVIGHHNFEYANIKKLKVITKIIDSHIKILFRKRH